MRLALYFALCGLAGCLSAFAPGLRARGPHTGIDLPSATSDDCMGCHESEGEALARIESANADAGPTLNPDGPPLVADWMVDDTHSCVECHRPRGAP